MTTYQIPSTARGTRIERGVEKRALLSRIVHILDNAGFDEIILPSLELAALYTEKMGPEVLEQMYIFNDKGGRTLSLRPEGTATLQELARTTLRYEKDVKLWYETRCWRYERPQAGRYREFTQVGVEILKPSRDYHDEMVELAVTLVKTATSNFVVDTSARRGLAYYVGDGFEINVPLGAQQQVCGGGTYPEGIGFAIGLDRLLLAASM